MSCDFLIGLRDIFMIFLKKYLMYFCNWVFGLLYFNFNIKIEELTHTHVYTYAHIDIDISLILSFILQIFFLLVCQVSFYLLSFIKLIFCYAKFVSLLCNYSYLR